MLSLGALAGRSATQTASSRTLNGVCGQKPNLSRTSWWPARTKEGLWKKTKHSTPQTVTSRACNNMCGLKLMHCLHPIAIQPHRGYESCFLFVIVMCSEQHLGSSLLVSWLWYVANGLFCWKRSHTLVCKYYPMWEYTCSLHSFFFTFYLWYLILHFLFTIFNYALSIYDI